jgi:thiamine biosynthesis protein ThiI
MGGLPLGTQGKVVILFSGGIYSPVASLLMIIKGCRPYFVYVDLEHFSSELVLKRAMDALAQLKKYYGNADLIKVPFGAVMDEIKKCSPALTCILCKRSMYKISNLIAKKVGAKALVTGESLGEVASQTLQNLVVLDDASEMVVFRPLVGLQKQEIVDLSKKYGIFDVYKNLGDCKALPERVTTHALLTRVTDEESKTELAKLIAEAAEKAEFVKI